MRSMVEGELAALWLPKARFEERLGKSGGAAGSIAPPPTANKRSPSLRWRIT